MQVKAAITPLPAQGSVPVKWSNPGSPKARKSQDVLARFGTRALLRNRKSGVRKLPTYSCARLCPTRPESQDHRGLVPADITDVAAGIQPRT